MTPPINGKRVGFTPPLLIPTHTFDSPEQMEKELLPGELLCALLKNTSNTGYEFHAALVHKDKDGRVYSVPMQQHHGDLKDTPENYAILHPQEKKSDE